MDYNFNILYYTELCKKKAKVIVVFILIFMLLTGLVCQLKSPVYMSSVRLLTIDTKNGVSSLGGLLGVGETSATDNAIRAILGSRRMAADINKKFNVGEKSALWWEIKTHLILGGLMIETRGPDPIRTKETADFTIENLEKINEELDVTINIPMVKVLDAAERGKAQPRGTKKKMLAVGMFTFLVMNFYIFFSDYINKLKTKRKKDRGGKA